MMNKLLILTVLFTINYVISQNKKQEKKLNTETSSRKFEDSNGKIIDDPEEIKKLIEKKQREVLLNHSKLKFKSVNAVDLCNNGNFEEFEVISGKKVLKNFAYTTDQPFNPTQCATNSVSADLGISEYNPNATGLMATTVPANYFDPYIGPINAYDQFALKINFDNSYVTSGVVQAKRFKTNNENYVSLNYKAVLESISGIAHVNEQPFFKVRIIRNNGIIEDEFCLIGDTQNCIFKEAPSPDIDSVILYTPNWQSLNLDISKIPNNEEFTIEMTAARCGLSGHFGYAFIDDICLLHTDENLQGSIELDPLFKICPTLPLNICGKFTLPNSGGITAEIDVIKLQIKDEKDNVIYTSTVPSTLDLKNKTFCFKIEASNLPNVISSNYNVSASLLFKPGLSNCSGTVFEEISDPDANIGWDISFLNCLPDCDITLQTGNLKKCDTDENGKEFFDLTQIENQLINKQNGLKITYFTDAINAAADTNPIKNPSNFESYTSTIYARVTKSDKCFKIIAFQLIVKRPFATISGILNVCDGNTVLTASKGVSYLWSNGATTQKITVLKDGIYSVKVTDSEGCVSEKSITILPTNIASSPIIDVVQPTCFIHTGTITVTTVASEYSFDGGKTWTSNNSISGISFGTYQVKIKTINGCISYDTNVVIYPFLSDSPNYDVTQPRSCSDFGSIKITTKSSEYSFDNGLTWTTSNEKTNLPIGNYQIRIKDAVGCISNFASVSIYGEFLNSPSYTTSPPYCSNSGSIIITSPADYFSIDGGTTWQTSNIFDGLFSGSYIIKVKTNDGCTSSNNYAYLNSLENSYPDFTIDQPGCNKYGTITITTVGDEYSFDNGLTWSSSNSMGGFIGNGQNVNLKIKKGNNCISLGAYAYIYNSYIPLPIVSDYETLVCDNKNDQNELYDLSSHNSLLVSNPSNYSFIYYRTLQGAEKQLNNDEIVYFKNFNLEKKSTEIFVRISDSYSCSSVAKLTLNLIATPVPTIFDQTFLCENKTVLLNENQFFDSYLWSTGQTTPYITVNKPGSYFLTVSEKHGNLTCSTTKEIVVILSNPAKLTSFVVNDWTDENNVIKVNVIGLGNYEYSLDGINYQDSNIFYNLEQGEYNVYIRDKNGCGITNEEIYVLSHPKFFTPNNDGYNDYWKINFSNNEPKLLINIYDRSGKLIKQMDSFSIGWDGTYNGKLLPSTDYWFEVIRQNGKIHKGNFTLKR